MTLASGAKVAVRQAIVQQIGQQSEQKLGRDRIKRKTRLLATGGAREFAITVRA
jgi:hypothetical protein